MSTKKSKKASQKNNEKITHTVISIIQNTFFVHFKSVEKRLLESNELRFLDDPESYCDYLVKTYVEKLDKEILIGINKNTISKIIGYDFINCLVKLFSIYNLLNYANKINNMTVSERIKYYREFTGNSFDDEEESIEKLAILIENYVSSLKSMHDENKEKYKDCVLDKYNEGQIGNNQLSDIMKILSEGVE